MPRNSSQTFSIASACTALILLLTLTIASVSRHGKAEPRRARHIKVAIDASYSNSSQLGSSIRMTSHTSSMLGEDDRLSVYRVDDKCKKVFPIASPSAAPPLDTDRFRADLIDSLQSLSKEHGTHSLEFWQDAIATSIPGMPSAYYYLTDGFEENKTPAEIAALRKAAEQLAASRDVRAVYLMGLNPKTHPFWRSTFAALGARLHITGPLTRESIAQFEEAVDANW